MSQQSLDDKIDSVFNSETAVNEALAIGVAEALERHKRAGQPIAVWRDGQVVWIPADEIKVPEVKSKPY
jgi:hypothetical protein